MVAEQLDLLAPAGTWVAQIMLTEKGSVKPVALLEGFDTRGQACMAAEKFFHETTTETFQWLSAKVEQITRSEPWAE